MMNRVILLFVALTIILAADAQTLVKGGQFQDLILPMEGSVAATANDWGTTPGENTEPKWAGKWTGTLGRWKDNGIEDNERSYWGGNIVRDDDGLYHLYVAGWPENSPRGHMVWSSQSRVYHVTAKNISGPYTFIEDIGEGHNPETYRTADGTYIIYIIGGRYTSKNINGPWKRSHYDFDLRGRKLAAGENRKSSLSNLSFARREDGSFLMVDRGGSMWVSRDGLHDAWHQLTDHSVYQGNRRYYEDPVLWRDSVQYHMIVNDWHARKAYYMRSLDGRRWVQEEGAAYCADPEQFPHIFSRHKDGTEERWYKYERPRIFQDEQGRAAYINFAVIDCVKKDDVGSDRHSSKNIVLPLQKAMLLEWNGDGKEATVLIKGEPGFRPKKDLDLKTLRYGNHSQVNQGKGWKVKKTVVQDNNLIVTFAGSVEESGLTADDWAAKVLGQKKDGSIAFGYVRLPGVETRPALLSSCLTAETSLRIYNYGQTTSQPAIVRVYAPDKKTLLGEGRVEPLPPYADTTVTLTRTKHVAPADAEQLVIRFFDEATGKELCIERLPLPSTALSSGVETNHSPLSGSGVGGEASSLMGWSSWNTYHVNISDSLIMRQADAMVSKGLKDAGYRYVNIDDGYFGGRDAKTGRLLTHPTRFPRGLKPVADHIHRLGLKAGIYSDAGANTCGSWYDNDTIAIGVGLYGHDQQDCDMFFKELGFDFIKIDFCGGNAARNANHLALDPQARYTAIRQAIDRTGRTDVRMNVCRWDYPGTWVSQVASSWRMSQDIRDRWSSVKDIIQQNLYLSAYASPGHYNDMDMLEVGRRMSAEEDHTHFAMWCIMSSPLLIGCDLTRLKPETQALLTNRDLIAINQDTLGLQAYVAQKQNGCYVLVKDIEQRQGLKRAFAIYNPTEEEQTVTVDMNHLDLGGDIRLRDLYDGSKFFTLRSSLFTSKVPAHGTRVYVAEATKRLPRQRYEAETAWLSSYQELYNPQAVGTAYYAEDAKCSGEMKATNLGLRPENDLQWSDVYCPTDGYYHITIHTVGFTGKKALYIAANNGDGQYFTAKDTTKDGTVSITIRLKRGCNTIRLYNDREAMPDVDYMEVEQTH